MAATMLERSERHGNCVETRSGRLNLTGPKGFALIDGDPNDKHLLLKHRLMYYGALKHIVIFNCITRGHFAKQSASIHIGCNCRL